MTIRFKFNWRGHWMIDRQGYRRLQVAGIIYIPDKDKTSTAKILHVFFGPFIAIIALGSR